MRQPPRGIGNAARLFGPGVQFRLVRRVAIGAGAIS